jgi:hypothetical protein
LIKNERNTEKSTYRTRLQMTEKKRDDFIGLISEKYAKTRIICEKDNLN